jgi:type II secretory pathway pseudopilin PulG
MKDEIVLPSKSRSDLMLANPRFSRPRRSVRQAQSGYILLMLMLVVTLLAIAAAAIAPTVAFKIRRDREEELIHRGVQYSRAVRRYVKKFGRYPTRLEELESTNNLRFLRKRYKDPITGQDFKVLHLGEVKLNLGAGMAGANSPGANPGVPTLGGVAPVGITGGPSRQPSAGGVPQMSGEDTAGTADANPQRETNTTEVKLSSLVFGGGPIVGVVSTSKDQSVREFNNKKRYDQWQFIYDPSTDRGGLLNTPAQPPLQGVTPNTQPGTSGIAGPTTSPVQPNQPTQPGEEPPQ